jgi:hypothetical protein
MQKSRVKVMLAVFLVATGIIYEECMPENCIYSTFYIKKSD